MVTWLRGGNEDVGFAGDFYADLVAEAEDSSFAGGRELDLDRSLGADLDLVEVAGAFEDAERDAAGDARAPRHRRLGHRQGFGPQHQEPAVTDAVGAHAGHGHPIATRRLHDDTEVAQLDDPDRQEIRGTQRFRDRPAPGPVVELG